MIRKLRLAVEEFMQATGQKSECVSAGVLPSLDTLKMRDELINEEFQEYRNSVDRAIVDLGSYGFMPDENLAEVADALCDLLYVTVGAAITWGVDLDPLLEEVHRVNMTKFPGGQVYRRSDGKVTKPPGFKRCDLTELVKEQVENGNQ